MRGRRTLRRNNLGSTMPPAPTGKITFLFTDIEGSTQLLHHLADRYVDVLGEHRRLLRAGFQEAGGYEVDTSGDGFFLAFAEATDALKGALAGQQAIAGHRWPEGAPIRVRMGIHTGEATPAFGGYVGLDVHRAARIMAAGYGGQILLSQATQTLIEGNLPEGVTLRDLGEYRLKDLSRPEHIFQVVTAALPLDFPPLRTLDVISNNLPIQLTSFIGREREIEEVKRLLSATRLLTLHGAGGAGKTRLANQVAADLVEEFRNGVWLVDLAPLADPALVVQTVASTLGVREVAGRTLLDTLADSLRPKTLLLVLDNCEHLVSACAHLAEGLLHACPNLRILATSREALRIAGETAYRVPSLSLPSAPLPLERITQYEAVRLFIDRAAAALDGFTVTPQSLQAVVSICGQLDGMPLAIELAAARVKALSVEQIAERLRDRFQLLTRGSRTALPRHQTLRATIDWSHDLLSEHERILLRRLAVFAGGWTLEAAEGVCGDESMDPADVLDRLTRLVDKSLVIMEALDGETRYRLLETVRQYSREKLLDSGEATRIRDRHRGSYLELAERAEPMLIGPEQSAWMERLEVEHSNLRVALEWSKTGDGGAEALVRLAAALWRFWNVRGYGSEGRGWLEAALSQAGHAPRATRARLLFGAGVLAWFQQESGRAAALGEESLALARELGDKRAVAHSLRLLAAVAWYDYERAKALGEESLALFRELGDKLGISAVLRFLGFHAMTYDEFEAAMAPFEESLRLARALKDERGIAWSLHGLGGVPFQQARYEEAVALHEEALSLFRDLGDKWGMSSALGSLGAIARYRGDYERAATLLEESLQVRKEMGSKAMIPLPLLRLGLLAQDQGDYQRAKSFYEESLALYREVGQPAPGPAGERWGVADALRALGIAARHEGDYARAAALLEESVEISREVRNKSSLADALDSLGTVAFCQGNDKRAGALQREALALRRQLGQRRGVAESLEGLASLAAAGGKPERAVRLLGAAEALREAIGTPLPPSDCPAYERSVSTLQQRLDERLFTTTWAEGRVMTPEAAIEYALSEHL